MGILRTRMERALVVRELSERTGRTYLRPDCGQDVRFLQPSRIRGRLDKARNRP